MSQHYVSISELEEFIVSAEWDRYRQFLDIMQTQLTYFLEDWEEELNERLQRLEEHQKDEFRDLYSDDLRKLQEHETLLTNSFFVASFSLLEHQLNRFCYNIQMRLNSPFSVSDLRGSFTDRARSYATKLGVPFPKDTPEWREIRKYQDIRNRITHGGGYVAPDWKHFSFLRTGKLVDTSEGEHQELYQIELTREFCDEALDNFEQFMLAASRAGARRTPQRNLTER